LTKIKSLLDFFSFFDEPILIFCYELNLIKTFRNKSIEARKADIQKQQEEYVKNLPDPEQPEGHRKLSDEERTQTLQLLKESKLKAIFFKKIQETVLLNWHFSIKKEQQSLLSEMNSLPIRNDTFRLVTCKTEMEKKLAQLDEAIKIFSKPKVFVKVD
jgi:hypothetical protein